MHFSVLTLNLWNVNEPLATRFASLAAGLKILRPDIICLQEVATDPHTGRRQSESIAKACGFSHGYDGDALSILSRYPVTRSRCAALPEFKNDDLRQVIMAEILVGGLSLLVANTHFAWRPEMTAERRSQAEALLAAVARFASVGAAKTKILCGDFNDDPDSPAIRLVLGSAEGFNDCYAACQPDDPGFTFSLKNPYVDRGHSRDQRIDYIFVTHDLTPKHCALAFDGSDGLELASDHYGVVCFFAP